MGVVDVRPSSPFSGPTTRVPTVTMRRSLVRSRPVEVKESWQRTGNSNRVFRTSRRNPLRTRPPLWLFTCLLPKPGLIRESNDLIDITEIKGNINKKLSLLNKLIWNGRTSSEFCLKIRGHGIRDWCTPVSR